MRGSRPRRGRGARRRRRRKRGRTWCGCAVRSGVPSLAENASRLVARREATSIARRGKARPGSRAAERESRTGARVSVERTRPTARAPFDRDGSNDHPHDGAQRRGVPRALRPVAPLRAAMRPLAEGDAREPGRPDAGEARGRRRRALDGLDSRELRHHHRGYRRGDLRVGAVQAPRAHRRHQGTRAGSRTRMPYPQNSAFSRPSLLNPNP